jgi:hypothetical protein
VWYVAGALLVASTAACDPFGLPSTRALENGAESTLSGTRSYEMSGVYTADGVRWTVDMQLTQPDRRHIQVASPAEQVEAIVIGTTAYFRAQAFLRNHLGNDPVSQNLAKVAGNSWWKGDPGLVPAFADLTDGAAFRANFLGPAATSRVDHQQVDGGDAVLLSGSRADVYIASEAPYRLLRVHLKEGVVVDGIAAADFRFSNVDRDFAIAAPRDVIDFSNLSTLPPVYTVLSVDTSACTSPCVVSAKVKNVGGMTGARAPSTVTFTMTDPITKQPLGHCSATVQPDVGYNSTATVSCTIDAKPVNGTTVTASAENPGRS